MVWALIQMAQLLHSDLLASKKMFCMLGDIRYMDIARTAHRHGVVFTVLDDVREIEMSIVVQMSVENP